MSHPGFGAHTDPTFQSEPRTTWEVVRRVGVYLLPYRLLAFSTVGCAVLSLGFTFVYPALTRYVIDDVIGKEQHNLLSPVLVLLLCAFLFRELFNSLRIRVNNHLEQHVIYDLRRDVYARLQRLPVGWFDQRASGDLMTRVIEDVNSVERVLIDGTEQGSVSLLSILGVLSILFWHNPALAGVALIPMPFLIAGALWYTLTAHKRYRAMRTASGAMNALLLDNLQGVRQVKSFGREDHEDQRFAGRAEDLRQGTLQVMGAWANYSPGMAFLNATGIALVLWYGGSLVLDGQMTVGSLVEFILYLNLFYDPVSKLHGLNQMLQSARAAGERVFDIMDATEERESRSNAPAPKEDWKAIGLVQYEGVQFRYHDERTILNDIALTAEPGQMIALVGPTGAGKSTLVNLLPAFYESTAGTIAIDNHNIRDIPLHRLRDQISIVAQEAFLFNGTIRENILYGRLDANEADVIAAAKAANCHHFIEQLPEGYDSKVGERGVKLSVGEKQRVSIARALLKDAPLLILDEATASVDTATEKLIQEALERLMTGRTSFVIAHRLSTIQRADQILVLRHGEIIERGTHEELLDHDGLYAKLARIQNTTFIEESFEKLELAESEA